MKRHGDVLLLKLSGRFVDTATLPVSEAVRTATRETDWAVLFDMGELSFISDWALRTIFLIGRDLRSQDTKLVLCALTARVQEKMRGTGFEQFLSIHESRAEALASLESGH